MGCPVKKAGTPVFASQLTTVGSMLKQHVMNVYFPERRVVSTPALEPL
jgi:hypothetical protein